MKNTGSISILLYMIIFISSCRDWEDSFSNGSLYDTWEIVAFRDDHKLNMVTTLLINQDGTFERSITYKQPNSNTIVGHYFISKGTHILDGNTITFLTSQSLFIGNDKPYGELNELKPVNFLGGQPVPVTSTLEYRDNGSKLVVKTPCNDVLSSLCAAPIYTRVR